MMKLPFKTIQGLMAAAAIMFMSTGCESNYVKPDAAAASVSNDSRSLNLRKSYEADLSSLNNSGATGRAYLTLNGDMLTVKIIASGMTPNQVHPQHIHGFTANNQNAICPPPSADTDGDGLIEVAEGAPFYGAILLPLQPFPTADAEGNITYNATFKIDKSLLPLQNNAIVLHGMMVNGMYVPTLPVACGQVKSTNNGNNN